MRGVSTLPTRLPSRGERLFPWKLDRRGTVSREIASELLELWQDKGGVQNLSIVKRRLCERFVRVQRKCVAYEDALDAGITPPFDDATYQGYIDRLRGLARDIGLEREARSAGRLDTSRYIARASSSSSEAGA
jgi:hypothetical protein